MELQQEEQPRPEYEAQCTHVVINEITQVRPCGGLLHQAPRGTPGALSSSRGVLSILCI